MEVRCFQEGGGGMHTPTRIINPLAPPPTHAFLPCLVMLLIFYTVKDEAGDKECLT